MSGGSLAGSRAAFATSMMSRRRSVPGTAKAPSANTMSCAETSSRCEAMSLPLSLIHIYQRAGVAAQRDGAAEVAMQRIAEPDQVLLRQRLIETHVAPLRFDFVDGRIRRQRHRGRIDRKQPQHAEQKRRHDQEDRYCREQAAGDQLENGCEHCGECTSSAQSIHVFSATRLEIAVQVTIS